MRFFTRPPLKLNGVGAACRKYRDTARRNQTGRFERRSSGEPTRHGIVCRSERDSTAGARPAVRRAAGRVRGGAEGGGAPPCGRWARGGGGAGPRPAQAVAPDLGGEPSGPSREEGRQAV